MSYSTKQQTLDLYHTIYRFFIRPNSYPMHLANVRHSNMHKQLQANSRNQSTARAGNQNRCRRDVVPVDKAPRSGMQPTKSGSTHTAHSVAWKSSPQRIVRRLLARPAKSPRRDNLPTVAYNDDKADQDEDRQQITEIFNLSDDSSYEYQNSHISDQNE